MGVSFAVRRQVLEDLLSDSVWATKLDEAKTMEKVEKVVVDFCKAKGYRVGRAKR